MQVAVCICSLCYIVILTCSCAAARWPCSVSVHVFLLHLLDLQLARGLQLQWCSTPRIGPSLVCQTQVGTFAKALATAPFSANSTVAHCIPCIWGPPDPILKLIMEPTSSTSFCCKTAASKVGGRSPINTPPRLLAAGLPSGFPWHSPG